MKKVVIPADLANALHAFLTERPQIWKEVGGMVIGLEHAELVAEDIPLVNDRVAAPGNEPEQH